MTSIFDPQQVLDAAITDTLKRRPPVTPSVYSAVIGEPKIRTWQGKADPSKSGLAIDIPLELQLTDSEAARIGQAKVVITGGGFLDTTDAGGLDMAPGRNRVLRTYYDATGLNKPGTTPRQLQGRMVKVQIGHRLYEGEPVEEVVGIAKA
jgi:hypothetical protein